ncbi:hypothetical protein [Paenibacillus lautus]|uniref:hypothetical protein n=1 Tax=Paenibacillus lautus TaxID=1401 RepID=UPI000FD7C0B5|nr:hypothetical protein [Paenibacillus lautus]
MESTDKGIPSSAASGVIRRAAAIAFEFGKSHLKLHSNFPNSTATEKDSTCASTADYFPFCPTHTTASSTAAPIQGAATRFAAWPKYRDGIDR